MLWTYRNDVESKASGFIHDSPSKSWVNWTPCFECKIASKCRFEPAECFSDSNVKISPEKKKRSNLLKELWHTQSLLVHKLVFINQTVISFT